MRVWSLIQFTSQVLRPSSEHDCSKSEVVMMSDQEHRITYLADGTSGVCREQQMQKWLLLPNVCPSQKSYQRSTRRARKVFHRLGRPSASSISTGMTPG
jgi:hypothetical protein